MIKRKWKVTFGVLGIATFFLLGAALNIWTGRAFYPGMDVDNDIGARFVSWESYPVEFCIMVSFKLLVGTSLLMLLGNAHWKRWRRTAHEKPGQVQPQSPEPTVDVGQGVTRKALNVASADGNSLTDTNRSIEVVPSRITWARTIIRTLVLLVLGLGLLAVSVHSLKTGEVGTKGSRSEGTTSTEEHFDRNTDPANFWLKIVGGFGFGILAMAGAVQQFMSDIRALRGRRQTDRIFYESLGAEDHSRQCQRAGCRRGAVPNSVLCKHHHFEMIAGRKWLFDD